MQINEYPLADSLDKSDAAIVDGDKGTRRILINEEFASKSIYGDDHISLGRIGGGLVGKNSFAFGDFLSASGENSHAEGYGTIAKGEVAHAEGVSTQANGDHSHAEGESTYANGLRSHTEGFLTQATGTNSHAEGDTTQAIGDNSHAEGKSTQAEGQSSHAEGKSTQAEGQSSHAEGISTKALWSASHAEGYHTQANGTASHAEGYYTNAYTLNHVSGQFNKTIDAGSLGAQTGDALVIGNGTDSDNLSNALRLDYSGKLYLTKSYSSSGADYAEFIKPWADNNPDNEDRVGYFVTIKDGFLHKANEGDYISGITSGNPSVIGNGDEDYYWRYERDEFNRIIWEDVPEVVDELDKETGDVKLVETGKIIPNGRMKLAEGYDSSRQESYVERAKRPEWDCVGMIGVLPVRDDGSCIPGKFCKCGINGVATHAKERGFDTFYVIERINDHVVSVELR